jgi:hypothetical protein
MGVSDIIAAIPTRASGDAPDGDLLRAELVAGVLGVIADDAAVVGGVLQVDPYDADLGALRAGYMFGDGIFKYDAADATTAHDGITCLVLVGGRRYKLLGEVRIKALTSRSVTVPPDPDDTDPAARPDYGDAYLVTGGSWSVPVDSIAVWTSRDAGSWVEVPPDYGPPLWVKDEKLYLHWDGDDGWQVGMGARTYPDASIPPAALLWDNRVQNQSTNAPPSTWSKGVAYIVGASASGDWAGQSGKIALAETDGVLADGDSFAIFSPYTGQQVYDIALGYRVSWNGTAWRSAAGAYVNVAVDFAASPSASFSTGSGGYSYSGSTAPTTAAGCGKLPAVAYQAIGSGGTRKLEIHVEIDMQLVCGGSATPNASPVLAILRDSESAAVAWMRLPGIRADEIASNTNYVLHAGATFHVDLADSNAHDYAVALFTNNAAPGSGTTFGTVARRVMTFRELA